MVTFLVILLFVGLVCIDFLPTYKNYKDNKRYVVFYIVVAVFSCVILVLKSFDVPLISTYDIVDFFTKK